MSSIIVNAMGDSTRVLMAGTFDPFTTGHLWIAQQAFKLAETLVVSVAEGGNGGKTTLFTLEERVDLVRKALFPHVPHENGCSVIATRGSELTVNVARKYTVPTIIRGVRSAVDFDYEFNLLSMNRRLAPEINTVLVVPTEELIHVSSTNVRKVLPYINDHAEASALLAHMVPSDIIDDVVELWRSKQL